MEDRQVMLEILSNCASALWEFKSAYERRETLVKRTDKEERETLSAQDSANGMIALMIGAGLSITGFVAQFLISIALFNGTIPKIVSNISIPAIIIIGVVSGIWYYKKAPKISDSKAEEFRQNRREIDDLFQRMVEIENDNQYYFQQIPEEYLYYEAVSFFYQVLNNGRADSLKEAMNLYEDHVFKQKQLASNEQMLEEMRKQRDLLKEISEGVEYAGRMAAVAGTTVYYY